MMHGMNILWVAVLAYLFGSIPFGVLVARTYQVDLQKVGSGNTGATNVLRATGWGPAIVVALADVMKGGVAVLIAQAFGMPGWEVALVGLCAVIGHNYSVFLGFKGGKGVATSFGTVALLDIILGLLMLPVFLITVLVTRFVSAGSIIGSFTGVLFSIALLRPWWMVMLTAGLTLMIVFKHRDNLARMYAGQERRIDERIKTSGVVLSDTAKPPVAPEIPPTEPETAPVSTPVSGALETEPPITTDQTKLN
jgi:glycerol-3-phosphate acyltransferase PlsY